MGAGSQSPDLVSQTCVCRGVGAGAALCGGVGAGAGSQSPDLGSQTCVHGGVGAGAGSQSPDLASQTHVWGVGVGCKILVH